MQYKKRKLRYNFGNGVFSGYLRLRQTCLAIR